MKQIEILPYLFRGHTLYIAKYHINPTSEKPCDKVYKLLYEIYISFLVDLEFIFFLFYLELFYYFSRIV